MCYKKIIIEIDKRAAAVNKNQPETLENMCEQVLKKGFGTKISTLSKDSTGLAFRLFCIMDTENEFILHDIWAFLTNGLGIKRPESMITISVSDFENENRGLYESSSEDVIQNAAGEASGEDIERSEPTALEKIKALEGCEEFKSLACELSEVAPQIVKHNTRDTFMFQNFLFSVNNGYGLTTYLSLFAELISETKLVPTMNLAGIKEIEIPTKSQNNLSTPFVSVLGSLSFASGVSIACIDISDWITRIKEPVFRKFLYSLSEKKNNWVIVFRVPLLEENVLREIAAQLSDVLYIRSVVFTPFDSRETRSIAKKVFGKMGYSMAEDAWSIFDMRIAEEKSDGRFYGIKTVEKVVTETVYRKQLSNVRKGIDNALVEREDILELAGEYDDINRSGAEELEALRGMSTVKRTLLDIVSRIEYAQTLPYSERPCIHMRFLGNPGTGKTTVARILGKLLRECGVLRSGSFFEYSGRDFCGQYIGETAPKTASICRDAYGSVLFIDEAYTLYVPNDGGRDFGREALATLVAEMENHRSDLAVIMAGYSEDMNQLMRGNSGLAGRMPYVIEFPNYSRKELLEIFMSFSSQRFELADGYEAAAREYFDSLTDDFISSKDFSNARFVRNIYERVWGTAMGRTRLEKSSELILKAEDVKRAVSDREFTMPIDKKRFIGFI